MVEPLGSALPISSSSSAQQQVDERRPALDAEFENLALVVTALQKQVSKLEAAESSAMQSSPAFDALRASVEAHLRQQNEAAFETEARLVKLEQQLSGDLKSDALAEVISLSEGLSNQQQVLQSDVARLTQSLSSQKASQESMAEKFESIREEVHQLIDLVTESQDSVQQLAKEIDQLAGLVPERRKDEGGELPQSRRDLLGLQAASEAHEELIRNTHSLVERLHDKINVHKREQDSHVRNFRAISIVLSKDLATVSCNVLEIKQWHTGIMTPRCQDADNFTPWTPRTPRADGVSLQSSGYFPVEREVEIINNKIMPDLQEG
jgi:chromosome segregation ATPase